MFQNSDFSIVSCRASVLRWSVNTKCVPFLYFIFFSVMATLWKCFPWICLNNNIIDELSKQPDMKILIQWLTHSFIQHRMCIMQIFLIKAQCGFPCKIFVLLFNDSNLLFGLQQVTGWALPCHERWSPGHNPRLFLQLMDQHLVRRWQTASGPSSAMLRWSADTRTH